ncbi:MAG: LapA family protein [Rhodospirillales bacterium]
MRWLSWIILLPLAAAVIVFSVTNRGVIKVDFWPFGYLIELPVFAIVLTSLLIGFVLGGIVAWITGAARRLRGRAAERDAAQLRRELAELRRESGRDPSGRRDRDVLPPAA